MELVAGGKDSRRDERITASPRLVKILKQLFEIFHDMTVRIYVSL
jgi:hypothetical protein